MPDSLLAIRRFSDETALIMDQGSVSWSQLSQHVASIQNQLEAQDLNQGDVLLAVTAHSSFELVLLYLACVESGIICALIPELPQYELERRSISTASKQLYVCPSVSHDYGSRLELDFSQFKEPGPCRFQLTNITSLIFTSGSTGEPKAVAHSAHSHLASARGIQSALNFDSQSCWLLSLPMFHVSGLAIVWRWLACGCRLRLKQNKSLHLEGVTHTSMVPTQLQRALDTGSLGDLESVLLGGAIIPHQLAIHAAEFGVETWAGYGMTEMASTVTAKKVNELDSVGTALPNRTFKLEGERIWVKGETLAQGYWYQGKLHALELENGWFDTKDLGRLIDGELTIIGRADNMFISGGENIHCEEIEKVLLAHPLVEQAYIVPVEDKTYGHRPVAMISGPLTLTLEHKQELEQLCLNQLQRFKRPSEYHLIPDDLLSHGIKVSRKQLARYLAGNRYS